MLRSGSFLRGLAVALGLFALWWLFMAVAIAPAPVLIESFEIEVSRAPDWGQGFILWMVAQIPGLLIGCAYHSRYQHPWRTCVLTVAVAILFSWATSTGPKAVSVGIEQAVAASPDVLTVTALNLLTLLLLTVFAGGRCAVRRLFPRKEAAPC